jgi:hypothetical protein
MFVRVLLSLSFLLSWGCGRAHLSPLAQHRARVPASQFLSCPQRQIELEVDVVSEATKKPIAVLARGCGEGVQLVRISGNRHWVPSPGLRTDPVTPDPITLK